MKTAQQWLDEYGESHRNPTNKLIHWVCVPAIMFSLIGLLWAIPSPLADFSGLANWGTAFLLIAVVYYFVLSVPLAFGMVMVAILTAVGVWLVDRLATPLWQISAAVFVIAWIGQFIGHKIEGKKPSFFKDIQFLLIGPLWLLGFIYRRLNIKY
ncbi:MAG: DUF962 domain-containing protein [Gammaproteobacteria bacterium]|nr:DUF962 domain-containing protein [Gammaproteobacteria bacterium]